VSGPAVDDPMVGLFRSPTEGAKEFYWVTDGAGRQLGAGLGNGSLGGSDRNDYLFNGGKFAGGSQNSNGFGSSRFESPIAPGFSSYRNRIYDQQTGRWTQEDPVGLAGGLNLYQFNGNNPVVFTDPFGLAPCPPCSDKDEALGRPLIGEEILLIPLSMAVGTLRGIVSGLARAFARDATRVAVSEAAQFATKASARSALAEMGLPEAQAAAVNRAIGRATRSTTIGLAKGEGGSVTVTLTRAGRDGKQVIESVVAADGTKVVVQKGINARGVVEHIDPK
jgi:RHS repeat-associated protein